MIKNNDYASLSLQLEDVLSRLQQPGIPVDEAVKLYEQGLRLVSQLETHLKTAENKLVKLKLQNNNSEG
jgi:exodeoxyribonuclease VII small subunit